MFLSCATIKRDNREKYIATQYNKPKKKYTPPPGSINKIHEPLIHAKRVRRNHRVGLFMDLQNKDMF